MASDAARKTLEDIRRELDAEYPPPATDDRLGEPDVTDPLVSPRTPASLDAGDIVVERPHEIAVEPHRPAPRRGGGRRGYVMAAAIGCIAGQALLVVAYVVVTRYGRDVIWPRALASASGLTAPLLPADDTTALPASSAGLMFAPVSRLDPQLEALRTDLRSLAAKLERAESRVTGAESRVSGVESRISGVESSMRRLSDDVTSAAVRPRQVERALSAPPQIAARPAPPGPLPPARAPLTATDSERRISSEHVAPPSPPPPQQAGPLAEAPPSALSAPPQPPRESSRSPETTAPTTDSAPSLAASNPSDSAPSSTTPPNLRDRLRDDWRTIKQGFASAGDDFTATLRDFARRVRGE